MDDNSQTNPPSDYAGSIFYSLLTDSANVVIAATHSNVEQLGMTSTSAEIYAMVQTFGVGLCTFDGIAEVKRFTPASPTPPMPRLTPRQLRLWLLTKGIKGSDVEAKLASLSDGAREAAQIEWEYATEYERTNSLVEQLGSMLGLSDAQMDDGFRAAALL